MSYKTILVHIESTELAIVHLRLAVAMAQCFDATLIGLGARAFDPLPDPTGMAEKYLRNFIADDLREAENLFHRETASLGDNARWQSAVDFPNDAMVRTSFAADLIIASRSPESSPVQTIADPGDLILGAGVPVLIAPIHLGEIEPRRIVIGWKNTREARRAIWDAIPFLKRAEDVHVVRILAAADESRTQSELSQLVDRLRRHDVKAQCQTRARLAASVAQDLIDVSDSLSAEMIVTGAYGYSRLRERILGGVTRGLLVHSPKMTLLSH